MARVEARNPVAHATDGAAGSARTPAASPKPAMSPEHKRALARGRREGRAVRSYLEALEATRPKRGRRRSTQAVESRLALVSARISDADPLSRVHLIQERINLQAELDQRIEVPDLSRLEAAFVTVAGDYGKRHGITWTAWRAAGVSPAVLRRSGIGPDA